MITPAQFIQTINDALHQTYMTALEESTTQWEARNEGDTISGSAVSKCIRLCYYRWFDSGNEMAKDPVFTDKLDLKSKRNMYFGLLIEDILIQALRDHGIPGGGIVHKDQDKEPVVVTHTKEGITLSAANDMVVEGLDNSGKFFIPTECKTTGKVFSHKEKGTDRWITPQIWWDEFIGYEEHKRQVMQWIYLAQKNNMRVPFGCLFYLRRGTLEVKFIIIMVDNDYSMVDGAAEVIDYNFHQDEMDRRNESLITSITMKLEPQYDPSVPEIICKGCNYLKQCRATR